MAVVTRQTAPGKKMSDSHRAAPRGFAQRTSAVRRRSEPTYRRWHDSPPPAAGASTKSTFNARSTFDGSSQSTSVAARAELEWHELIEQFDRSEQMALNFKKPKAEGKVSAQPRRRTKRKARTKHRPFRLSLPTLLMAAVPASLLVYLLSVNSAALTLSHQNIRLQNQMEDTRFELQRIRKEIAAVNAAAQVEEWAQERGWRQATQQDFDDVSSMSTGGHKRDRTVRE